MKQKIQLLSVFFTVASAGLAFGCGCSSEVIRVQPVRELSSSQCLAPVGERVTTYTTVTYQNKCIGSGFLLPMGERYRTWKQAHDAMYAPPVGERIMIVKTYNSTILQPVGEKVIIKKSCILE